MKDCRALCSIVYVVYEMQGWAVVYHKERCQISLPYPCPNWCIKELGRALRRTNAQNEIGDAGLVSG